MDKFTDLKNKLFSNPDQKWEFPTYVVSFIIVVLAFCWLVVKAPLLILVALVAGAIWAYVDTKRKEKE